MLGPALGLRRALLPGEALALAVVLRLLPAAIDAFVVRDLPRAHHAVVHVDRLLAGSDSFARRPRGCIEPLAVEAQVVGVACASGPALLLAPLPLLLLRQPLRRRLLRRRYLRRRLLLRRPSRLLRRHRLHRRRRRRRLRARVLVELAHRLLARERRRALALALGARALGLGLGACALGLLRGLALRLLRGLALRLLLVALRPARGHLRLVVRRRLGLGLGRRLRLGLALGRARRGRFAARGLLGLALALLGLERKLLVALQVELAHARDRDRARRGLGLEKRHVRAVFHQGCLAHDAIEHAAHERVRELLLQARARGRLLRLRLLPLGLQPAALGHCDGAFDRLVNALTDGRGHWRLVSLHNGPVRRLQRCRKAPPLEQQHDGDDALEGPHQIRAPRLPLRLQLDRAARVVPAAQSECAVLDHDGVLEAHLDAPSAELVARVDPDALVRAGNEDGHDPLAVAQIVDTADAQVAKVVAQPLC